MYIINVEQLQEWSIFKHQQDFISILHVAEHFIQVKTFDGKYKFSMSKNELHQLEPISYQSYNVFNLGFQCKEFENNNSYLTKEGLLIDFENGSYLMRDLETVRVVPNSHFKFIHELQYIFQRETKKNLELIK